MDRDLITYRWNGTVLSVFESPDAWFFPHRSIDGIIDEIDQYVRQHNLGQRMAWHMWQFRNKECITMFRLKFN